MNITFILGTRPEIIKLSPVIRECQQQSLPFSIIHTNQHYSANMDKVFFDELNLPQPDFNLGIHASSHGEMTGRMLIGIEPVLMAEKPDWVLVQGDTNTVLAGAIAAAKLHVKIGHVEAGLRSYDRSMPEEINRVVADHLSTILFAPTGNQAEILKGEGIESNKIIVVGNTVVDAVIQNLKLVLNHPEYEHYQNEHYFLLTAHRPANVDQKDTLQTLISNVTEVAKTHYTQVYYPTHPRTQKNLDKFQIPVDTQWLKLMEPVGYLEMLAMEQSAQLILTDSGGIQEEACVLHVPCLTLRSTTERPETVDVGAGILVGLDRQKTLDAGAVMLAKPKDWPNPFGNGKAAQQIIASIT